MMTFARLAVPLAAIALLFSGCQEETAVTKPKPIALTQEAAGYYCQMTVLEHDGPKAQIHLEGNPNPIWFTQVRDAIAFMRLPEEPKDYVAVYVNDMGKAESWADPGEDNWIDAEDAWFVVESGKRGGMGAPEAIPFAAREAADALVALDGGRVLRLDEIPDAYVLAPVDTDAAPMKDMSGMSGMQHSTEAMAETMSAGAPAR